MDSDIGYFELVIKVDWFTTVLFVRSIMILQKYYLGDFVVTCKQMYPQGRMSHHFREMREGDYMAVKGPKVKLFPFFSCLSLPQDFPHFPSSL